MVHPTLSKQNKEAAALPHHPIILVVDDDQDQLLLFETMLKSHGYTVVVSLTAQNALEILNDLHVDLVISDVMMPEMNGKELVSALRRARGNSGLPVIAMSSGSELSEIELVDSGANMFIKKQEATGKLLASIDLLVDSHQETTKLLLQIQSRYS